MSEDYTARTPSVNIERKLGKRGTLALVELLLIFLGSMVDLTEGQQERLGRKDSGNVEAYRSFIQGWEFSSRPAQETNTQHLAAHVHLACIYSETGRNEEVQLESTAILRISPNFSVEGMRQRLPYKDPVVVERYLAALRKAGLK